jgi:hypothetical protein
MEGLATYEKNLFDFWSETEIHANELIDATRPSSNATARKRYRQASRIAIC